MKFFRNHIKALSIILVGLCSAQIAVAQDMAAEELAAQELAAQELAAQDLTDDGPIGGFGLRLGYNSNLGAVAGVEFVSGRVFGLDHHLGLSAQVSKTDQRLNFDYSIPALSDGSPEWGLALFRNDSRATNVYNFDTLSYGIRPSWTRALSDAAQLSVVADVSSNQISNLAAGSSALIANDLGQSNKTGLAVKYKWQAGETVLRLSTGFATTSDDRTFMKTEASFAKNWSAPDANIVVTSSLNMGHLAMTQGQSNIGERFFLGTGQMRGFDLAGMGPRDLAAGNAALGGNSYGALKLDISFPNAVRGQDIFVPGMFFDMGSVWGLDNTNGGPTGTDPVDDQNSIRSVIGLSAKIDFGRAALNIYASRPLQKLSYDIESRFQVSLAAKF